MRVALIGGTGFIGGYIVESLLRHDHAPSLLVRHDSDNKIRKRNSCRIVYGDLSENTAIDNALTDCAAVIFNVGILKESPALGITFKELQFHAVERVIASAKRMNVRRFILMSANGIHPNGTEYQKTKHQAEDAVVASGLDYTIIRPSVVFGDPRGRMEIATQLYRDVVRIPLPAAGFTTGLRPEKDAVRMSPVHVEDVADAFALALSDEGTIGQAFNIGGGEVLSWKEMIKRVGRATGKNKWVFPAPIWFMKIPVALLQWIPEFPATTEQLSMLAEGNIASEETLEKLIGRQARSFTVDELKYLLKHDGSHPDMPDVYQSRGDGSDQSGSPRKSA